MTVDSIIPVWADRQIYQLDNILPQKFSINTYGQFDPNQIPENTKALLIRTVAKLNRETIYQIPKSISFIGTASAGFDHADLNALRQRNIRFANAAGCNARAVAEYVITSILVWADQKQESFSKLRLGIIGVGHVGSQVVKLANSLGINCVLYDPPREKRDSGFQSARFEDLFQCDVLSFHTPLEASTHYLYNESRFNNRPFKLLINCARGGIVNEEFLLNQKKKGFIQDFILDCWENEPDFNFEMIENAFIATPHIAGYSEQAKIRATEMICEQLSSIFQVQNTSFSTSDLKKEFLIKPGSSLVESLLQINPILEYDAQLRESLKQKNSTNKKELFNLIRNTRSYRYEYPNSCVNSQTELHPILMKLGISLQK